MSKKIPVYLTIEQMNYLFKKIGQGGEYLTDDEMKLAELLDELIHLNEEKFEDEATVIKPLHKPKKRMAKCSYGCKDSIVESSSDLAFFQSNPEQEFDRYYCGCYGWD